MRAIRWKNQTKVKDQKRKLYTHGNENFLFFYSGMRRIVDLPKSGEETIFEPSSDQYFYITNSEISRLGGFEMTKSSLDELAVFQMGYTNLWLMQRVLLLKPTEFRFEYEESLVQT